MDKLKTHLKNNFAIYAVLLTSIIVICIAIAVNSTPKVETVDTSMFKVVSIKEVLNLFEQEEPVLLVMSVETCTATLDYVPYLQIAQAKGRYNTYYLDLNSIDTSSEEFKLLREKLDLEYEFYGTIGKFSDFIENTPSTVIIKNKKQVYGHIGSISTDSLGTLTKLYGVSE